MLSDRPKPVRMRRALSGARQCTVMCIDTGKQETKLGGSGPTERAPLAAENVGLTLFYDENLLGDCEGGSGGKAWKYARGGKRILQLSCRNSAAILQQHSFRWARPLPLWIGRIPWRL